MSHRYATWNSRRQDRAGAKLIRAIATAFALVIAPLGGMHADDGMKGLDEQVQEVKSDVLSIAAELRQLEEKLLFPSNTQVAVFVSLAEGDSIEIDSVKIEIDGEPATRHVYSFKELEALRKGGVQRVYTGNVLSGKHRIDVSMVGSSPGGSTFEESASFPFEKAAEPKVVSLKFAGRAVGGAEIEFGDL